MKTTSKNLTMKTMMRKSSVFFALLCSLFLASCSDDDVIIDPEPEPEPTDNELSGELTEDLTLDPEVEYVLTDMYSVEEGATLTIPAGTTITAEEGQNIFIAVQQGAEIDIQGTQDNPVVLTSVNGEPGDWGGLVLLGEAETTAGVDVTAEVSGLIYGGTDNADSSGSINYLIIEGAGAIITGDSEYNGLSLYAVGSGTTIQNVAVLNGADDGVEFFGGTVSASNIYLENNEDDSVDWTEGWNGTITNTYVLHTIEGFSTAIEADKLNNNPQIENFTAVSETGGIALQFKKESGATITGLSLSGYDTTFDFVDGGAFSNVQVEGEDANPELDYANEASVDVSTFDWVK